jgi:hypothetical protein
MRPIVANELSFVTVPDRHAARRHLDRFVATLRRAVGHGAERGLRSPVPLGPLPLAPDYVFSQWRNDAEVDVEARRWVRSLQINCPAIGPSDGAAVLEREQLSEFRCGADPARGLGTAWLLDGLCVSLGADARWTAAPELPVVADTIDAECNFSRETVTVRHACAPEHADAHADWLGLRDAEIASPLELWERRAELFPGLVFCDDVRAQLEAIDRGAPVLRQIVEKLRLLDRHFRQWDGVFEPDALGVKVTMESESTMQQFAAERTFRCPDEVERTFEWHVRMTPGAWRLYFFPDAATRRAIVGYVGPKPSTTKYRT